MNVAGLILAGGASRRMGSPKALLTVAGETFLDRLIRVFSECCDSVTVVLGHDWERLQPVNAAWVVNPEPERGMLSSLQTGLRALPPSIDAVVYTPVDYPGIQPSTVRALVDAFTGTQMLVRPRYRRQNGHPILLASTLVPEFLSLGLDETAREVVHRHVDSTTYLDLEDPGILRDVDNAADYAELLAVVTGE